MVANDRDHIDAITGAFDQLDVLMNNAGESHPGGYESRFEPDIFEATVEILLFGPYRLAQALRPALARSDLAGGASVVNMASLSAYFGMDAVPGYGAAKAAIVQLTKTLAISWADDRIRVNAIAPGNVRTRIFDRTIDVPEVMDPLIARTPLGRLGEVEEMIGPVLFLTSPEASFITGQTVPVCGGYSIY
jgi:NAD(P)-dependent dehydrogenase (short-subunit alcohol dehydrogenase family)